jgi:two-component system, OmpR family, response regulator
VAELPSVAVIRWPGERARRDELARAGLPRVLLVEEGVEPPDHGEDCLQDWVRMPVDPVDLDARLLAVAMRSLVHPNNPEVDDCGRLLSPRGWVALSPLRAGMARVMVERFGEVVPDRDLVRAGWGDGHEPTSNALRVHLARLRAKLDPLGLEIRVVPQRGYVLQFAGQLGLATAPALVGGGR